MKISLYNPLIHFVLPQGMVSDVKDRKQFTTVDSISWKKVVVSDVKDRKQFTTLEYPSRHLLSVSDVKDRKQFTTYTGTWLATVWYQMSKIESNSQHDPNSGKLVKRYQMSKIESNSQLLSYEGYRQLWYQMSKIESNSQPAD